MKDKDVKRGLYFIGGYGLFALGLIGVILPILPTTIFWILALACFSKSSMHMAERILNWPGIGPVISDYAEFGIVRRRSKIMAIFGMSLAAGILLLLPISEWVLIPSLTVILAAGLYVGTRRSERVHQSDCESTVSRIVGTN